jgi:predicted DNA-binding protein
MVVTLLPAERQRLRRLSYETERSMCEIVREALDLYMTANGHLIHGEHA